MAQMSFGGVATLSPGTDLGRYKIVRRLGEGGMGVVYAAFDRELELDIALKLLRRHNPRAIDAFKREFRSLADVHHPNLVQLHELVFEDKNWFFTMELVDGRDFQEHVRDHHDPEFEALRDALPQLAEGVHALHGAGKLHRDIKPSNVLVDRIGRVVVVDFGLVASVERMRDDSRDEPLIGTVAYMAPEQAAGGSQSPASDWYSVGVMLYLGLTGRLPFDGQPLDVLSAKQSSDPPPPGEIGVDVPDDLDALCCEMLRLDPAQRPSGDQILGRLGVGAPQQRRQRSSDAPFVGRPKQLAAMARAFDTARGGTASIVHVFGPSGVGKSSLVSQFYDRVRREVPDTMILRGRCYERESVPYKGLDTIVDELSARLRTAPAQDVAELVPFDAPYLARLFPSFRWLANLISPQGAPVEHSAPHEQRRKAFVALREMLTALAKTRPVAIALDDLQWGDVDSATLLCELLEPPDAPAIALILSYRGVDAETSEALRVIAGAASPLAIGRDSVTAIELDALAPKAARKLALALLESSGDRAKRQADAITRESGGNPYFIGELSRFVNERGSEALSSDDDRAPTTPPSLDELIAGRLEYLPDPARRLLDVICVAGHPLRSGIAVRAADVQDQSQQLLEQLLSDNLIRTRAMVSVDAIEPYHDRIREAVAAAVEFESAQDIHRDLADVIAADDDPDPELLAVHYRAAGEGERAAQYTAITARRADTAYAFERAARQYQMTLELLPDDAENRGELLESCAAALANSGRASAAAQIYSLAASRADSRGRLQLHRLAAEQLMRSGHISEGLELYGEVLESLGVRLMPTARKALVPLLLRRAWLRLRGYRFRRVNEADAPAAQIERIDTLYAATLGLAFVDPIRAMYLHTFQLHTALQAGEPYRVTRALGAECAAISTLGTRSLRRTERLLERVRVLASSCERPPSLPHAPRPDHFITAVSGIALFQSAQWSRSRPLVEATLTYLRNESNGTAWEIATAEFHLVWLLFWLGDLDAYERTVSVALRTASDLDDLYARTAMRLAGTYRALRRDDADRARKDALESVRDWAQPGFQVPHFNALFVLTHTDLYERRPFAAWRRVLRGWRAFSGSLFSLAQQVRVQMENLRGICAVGAAVNGAPNPSALLRIAAKDARRLDRERTPFATPCAELIRSALAAANGQLSRAATLAESAAQGFAAAEMTLYAAAATWRHGELVNDESVVAEAREAFVSRGIARPARWVDMLAPGFRQDAPGD